MKCNYKKKDMIKVEVKNEVYEIKSSFNEINLSEYDKMSAILNSKKSKIRKVVDFSVLCGLPESIAIEASFKSLMEIYRSFNLDDLVNPLKKSFKLNDDEFVFDWINDKGDLELNGRMMIKLEDIITGNKEDVSAKLIDEVTSCKTLSGDDKFNKIKNTMNADIAAPYLTKIYGEIVTTLM